VWLLCAGGHHWGVMTSSLGDIIHRLRLVLRQRGIASHDADDCIQEAFGRLEQYRKSQHVTHEEGFLVRTAVNIAIDKARQAQRKRLSDEPVESHAIADDAPLQDDVYASRRRLERLRLGVEQLDPVTGKMLIAHRLEDVTIPELARRNGLSTSTVEKRLAKAMAFLMEWMDGW
jgi:RNA polymerase sigma factor (sigma-70 family)